MRWRGSPSTFSTLRRAGRRCRSSAAKPCGPSSWSTPPPRRFPERRPRSSPRGWAPREEVQRAGVEGRIALVQRGEITFREKVETAAAAGAVGVVVYNNRSGPVQGATLITPSRIPAVIISQEEGERLLARLRQGAGRGQPRVDTLTEQRPTWNVIGRRAGRSARTVVIGAPLDSVEVSPGANDNGSGIAAALEAARLLAKLPLEFSVEIVGFGAEERGLLGSAHYVRERGNQVGGRVNGDVGGVGRVEYESGSGESKQFTIIK